MESKFHSQPQLPLLITPLQLNYIYHVLHTAGFVIVLFPKLDPVTLNI